MSRPRDASFEHRIVDACVELLGETGRAGLSRAQIARRAGVSVPAVNRRYVDVDAVLVAVARRPGGVGPAEDEPAPDSLRTYLVVRLLRVARAFRDPGLRRATSELLAAAAGDTGIGEAFAQTLAEQRRTGLAWVERARASGEVAPDVDGELLLDLTLGSAYYRLLWRGEAITEADATAVVDQVLGPPRA